MDGNMSPARDNVVILQSRGMGQHMGPQENDPMAVALARVQKSLEDHVEGCAEQSAQTKEAVDTVNKNLNLHILAFQNQQEQSKVHRDTTARIEKAVEDIRTMLGAETEDGDGGWKGTGLIGRMRRTEGQHGQMMKLYRKWIAYGAGFTSAFVIVGGAFLATLWFLIGDKVAVVLKGTPLPHP